MTSAKIVAQPLVEPVTLAEMKLHLRVNADAEDELISGLVVAARQWAENYTGRTFIEQTWQLNLDEWPCLRYVLLPKAPLITVNSVKYFSGDDNYSIWSSDNYVVDCAAEPGKIVVLDEASMPLAERSVNGIVIEYVSGYGVDGSFVPDAIKLVIKLLVAFWFEHRGDAGGGVDVPSLIYSLLNPYRIRRLGPI